MTKSQRERGLDHEQRTHGLDKVLRRKNARLLRVIRQYVNSLGIDPRQLVKECFMEVVANKTTTVQNSMIEQTIRDEIGRALSPYRTPQGSGKSKLKSLIKELVAEEVEKMLKDHLHIQATVTASIDHKGYELVRQELAEAASF